MAIISDAITQWLRRPAKASTILIGDDPRMRLLATELGAAHKSVSLIKLTIDEVDEAAPGVNLVYATAPGEGALAHAAAEQAICLIASTSDNELNQSLCEIARDKFQVPATFMRLCLVSGVTSWVKLTDGGMARMQWAEVVRAAIGDVSPGPLLAHLARVAERDQIVDLELQSPVFVGRKIADLPLNKCEVLALTRNGNSVVDFSSLELCLNDVLTLVGRGPALKSIQESLASL